MRYQLSNGLLDSGFVMEFDSHNYLSLLQRLIHSKPGVGEKLKSVFSSYGHIEAYEHLLSQLETEVQSRVRYILATLNEIDEPTLLDRELEKILSVIDRILQGDHEDTPGHMASHTYEAVTLLHGAEGAAGSKPARKKKAKKKAKAKVKSASKTKSKTKKKATKSKSAAKPAKKKTAVKKASGKAKAKGKVKKKSAAKKAAPKKKAAGKKKPVAKTKAKSKAKAKPKKKAGAKKKK